MVRLSINCFSSANDHGKVVILLNLGYKHMSIAAITQASDAKALIVTLNDGKNIRLSAEFLRINARDAISRRQMIDKSVVSPGPDIQITGIYPVGHTGLNITFSDGNYRAIYPYSYIRSLIGKAAKDQTSQDHSDG